MEEKKEGGQNPYIIPVSIIIAGALIGGAVLFSQGSPTDNGVVAGDPTPPGNQGQAGAVEEVGDLSIDLEGWPSIGDPDAPVVIVEYSDYACPFCQRFWSDTLPSIKQEYIDTGKARFVYKDFAVVGGDRAAEAAHCAGEQGSYWEYHDMLFERHAQDRAAWGSVATHVGYANELGLNADELASCFEERRYQDKVVRSSQEAQANGGRGTPYFLINDQDIAGAQPFAAFRTAIDLAWEQSQ